MGRLVAIALPGGRELVDTVRRLWDAGDAVLPLDPGAPRAHLQAILAVTAPAVVLDAQGEHALEGSRPVEEGDALVITTSGTSGAPKAAVHTHRAVEIAARTTSTALGSGRDAVWLACLPLWHVGGFSVITRALHSGAGLVVHDRFDATAVDDAARRGATHVSLVPAVLDRIDTTAWRRILLGGSAVPTERPANAVASYGMTETLGGVVYDGVPLEGVEVRVAGAGDSGGGRSGRIELRSPTLLRCYRDGVDPRVSGGWFPSGDVGRIDPDGRLVVEGRADHVIVTGGEKVWPEPVERRLEAHPDVGEAAVFGRDDPQWGQRVVARIVVRDPSRVPPLGALREWVRARLPAPWAPRELEVAPSLPRTSLGKLARHSLSDAGPSRLPPDVTDAGDDPGAGPADGEPSAHE